MSPQKRPRETNVDDNIDGRNVQSAKALTALSQTALERHDRAVQDDDRFAENVTRDEAGQQFQRALYGWYRGPVSDTPAASSRTSDGQILLGLDVGTDLTQIVRHHRPAEPSNATPFERYLTLATVNEPFPLHAKKALSDMAIDYGSLESVRARSGTARMLANEATPKVDSGSEGEEDGSLSVRKMHSAPPEYKTKVQRAPSLNSSQTVSGKTNDGEAKRTKTG